MGSATQVVTLGGSADSRLASTGADLTILHHNARSCEGGASCGDPMHLALILCSEVLVCRIFGTDSCHVAVKCHKCEVDLSWAAWPELGSYAEEAVGPALLAARCSPAYRNSPQSTELSLPVRNGAPHQPRG